MALSLYSTYFPDKLGLKSQGGLLGEKPRTTKPGTVSSCMGDGEKLTSLLAMNDTIHKFRVLPRLCTQIPGDSSLPK